MGEDQLGYEEARDELVDVVRRLESGGTDLEESLALWERGEQLAKVCQGWLDGAKERLARAVASSGETGAGRIEGAGTGTADTATTGARTSDARSADTEDAG